jgi:hypothetical protein
MISIEESRTLLSIGVERRGLVLIARRPVASALERALRSDPELRKKVIAGFSRFFEEIGWILFEARRRREGKK